MKTRNFIAIISIVFFGTACNNSTNQNTTENQAEMEHESHHDDNSNMHSESENIVAIDTSSLNAGDVYYQCKMHPDVTASQSGNCTKCKMALTEKAKK